MTNNHPLEIHVSQDAGKVVLHFTEAVQWVGLPPDQAIELAGMLVEKAESITGR